MHWVGNLVTKHLRHCYRSQQLMTHVRGHFFLTLQSFYTCHSRSEQKLLFKIAPDTTSAIEA